MVTKESVSVDEDWREVQQQIDDVVHEHDPPTEEPPVQEPPLDDSPSVPTEPPTREIDLN